MNLKNPLRILVADDFAPWRVQTRFILRSRPEWQVIADACDGLEVVQKTIELRPDIILLDIGMPQLDGFQAAKLIRQCSPTSKIIFVTQEDDSDFRIAALSIGVEGYLLKEDARIKLLPAIEAVLPYDRNPY